jgi:threonine-phosphate decarboxylase
MKHGGNIYRFAELIGCLPEQVLDFSANINPEQAVDLSCLQHVQPGPYADPDYSLLKQAIRHRYGYPANADIEVFNGASAAIFALLRRIQPQVWFYIRLCMANTCILRGSLVASYITSIGSAS